MLVLLVLFVCLIILTTRKKAIEYQISWRREESLCEEEMIEPGYLFFFKYFYHLLKVLIAYILKKVAPITIRKKRSFDPGNTN
jgi:hypothetical protein